MFTRSRGSFAAQQHLSVIGTKPTSRNVRCLVAVGGKADIRLDHEDTPLTKIR